MTFTCNIGTTVDESFGTRALGEKDQGLQTRSECPKAFVLLGPALRTVLMRALQALVSYVVENKS